MNCICLGEETKNKLVFACCALIHRCFLVILCLSSKKQPISLLTSVSWSQRTPGLTWQRQQPEEWTAWNRSTLPTTSSRCVHARGRSPHRGALYLPQGQRGKPLASSNPCHLKPLKGLLLYWLCASFSRSCGHQHLHGVFWSVASNVNCHNMTCSSAGTGILQGRELAKRIQNVGVQCSFYFQF